jgi:hypothetical protein
MVGVQAFDLPYTFFNALLKPKDAKISRINEILRKEENYSEEKT